MAKTAAVKASKKPLKKRIWDQRYLFLLMAVSYTHLDVYKRQILRSSF